MGKDKKPLNETGRVLGLLIAYLEREDLMDGVTGIWLEDLSYISFLYEDRIRVELGSDNSLDYKMQLAGYLLRNENGDALGAGDEGVLDCSHITQKGEIRPVFSPDEPEPEPEPEGEEAPEEESAEAA